MTFSDLGGEKEQTAYLNKKYGTGDSSEQNNTVTSNAAEDKSDSGVKMKPSAFKMHAKSPATKKLQGAQNTLPQQLQDAIKAAPGKMKSPMKKGYFKKY
jgi:hypothetical protein